MTKKNKTTKKTWRTPIVTVMGHVDHGKTTLLDSIRGANVTADEAGGITQNTRAHQIESAAGNKITFIDTPGHKAFSSMRKRGAQVTDIVLLVVAADDGLQPQTLESIEFAKETNTPVIVAINKIDVTKKNIDKIKTELSSHGITVEDYGGDTMCFEISALKQTGLDELVEGIELFIEVNGLPEKTLGLPDETVAEAYVLEAQLDKHLGYIALCILTVGELQGREFGATANQNFSVRAYLNEYQKREKHVNQSDPFWVTGMKSPSETGETIHFVKNRKQALELEEKLTSHLQKQEEKSSDASTQDAGSLIAQMFAQKTEEAEGVEQKVLPVIIRASSQGTLEAVQTELDKLSDEDTTIEVLEAGIGAVTEKDIDRTKIAKGIILSFQQEPTKKITDIARREKVLVRNYEIIYEMIDEVEAALAGLIEPDEYEVEVARAQVKKVFELSGGEMIAGSEVTSGNVVRGYDAWIERKGKEIARGKITQLRIHKEEVRDVKKGLECGIMIEPNFDDLQSGDEIVAFKVEKD